MMIIHIFIIIYLLFGLYVRLKAAKYCHNSQVATLWRSADMKFVKNFTPSDFQAKNFTPSISPNFTVLVIKSQKNE